MPFVTGVIIGIVFYVMRALGKTSLEKAVTAVTSLQARLVPFAMIRTELTIPDSPEATLIL